MVQPSIKPKLNRLDFRQIGLDELDLYASVSSSFQVTSIFRVEPVEQGLGGLRLVEEPVAVPYEKDYDATGGIDTGPRYWLQELGTEHWEFHLALDGGRPAGGVTLFFAMPGVSVLHGRRDAAVLWDIRVAPRYRGQGLGSRLFHLAAARARQSGFRRMQIETQNVNVPACRFYAALGCTLEAINRNGYVASPQVAHETMLLWYYDLQEEQP